VLNSVSFKYLNVAGVHTHRDIYLYLSAGNAHHSIEVLIQTKQLGGAVKALAHRFERVLLVTARKPAHFIRHRVSHFFLFSGSSFVLLVDRAFVQGPRTEPFHIQRDKSES
jgi:hypothetical protein